MPGAIRYRSQTATAAKRKSGSTALPAALRLATGDVDSLVLVDISFMASNHRNLRILLPYFPGIITAYFFPKKNSNPAEINEKGSAICKIKIAKLHSEKNIPLTLV